MRALVRAELRIPLSGDEARLLAVLGRGRGRDRDLSLHQVAEVLVRAALDGARSPNGWQRGVCEQVFGYKWQELLEDDPAQPGRQRPRREVFR